MYAYLFLFLQLISIINTNQMASKKDQDYNDSKELKKSHSFISIKKKQRLIELVVQTHMSIYKAAKRLNICHPTAKFIMKNYRKLGGQVIQTKQSLDAPVENNQPISPILLQQIQQDPNSLNLIRTQSIPNTTEFPQLPTFSPQMWIIYNQSIPFQPLYYYA